MELTKPQIDAVELVFEGLLTDITAARVRSLADRIDR
jgi:hypothetical protein